MSPTPRNVPTLLLLGALTLLPATAWAWGSTGHQAIASQYGESLPEPLQALRANDTWVVQHVMDPDSRKSSVPTEGVRHYIDIDAYPEYFTGTLSHERAVLEAEYGASTVSSRGIVPWAIGEVVDSMSTAMRNGNWDLVKVLTADLCHYTGDIHQPLHCTENYDGQYTGNSGIHSRYESTMLNQHAAELQLDAGTVTYYPDAVDAAFDFAGESQVDVAAVLAGDNAAKAASGGSTSSTTYYNTLWAQLSALTLERLTGGAVGTASFVYSAWVDAGYPPPPGSTVDAGGLPASAGVSLAAASPARDRVAVRFSLPVAGRVTLDVFDARGRRVARLAQGDFPAGASGVSWDPGAGRAAPGLYFLRLAADGQVATTRVVYTH